MVAGHRNALDVSTFSRDFERVRRGYDPAAVDHHLALIKSQVQVYLERAAGEPDESLDLVLKATRRSVDEALHDARVRADAIIADAHADAAQIRADAASEAGRLAHESRERYDEMGRLTAERARELASLDSELSRHAAEIRATAAELVRTADAIHTLDQAPATGVPSPVAAMSDHTVEVTMQVEPGSER